MPQYGALLFCTVTWTAAPASTTCRHQLVSSVNIYWPSQTKERPVQPLLRFNPLLALPSGTTSFVPCAPSLSSRLRPRHRHRAPRPQAKRGSHALLCRPHRGSARCDADTLEQPERLPSSQRRCASTNAYKGRPSRSALRCRTATVKPRRVSPTTQPPGRTTSSTLPRRLKYFARPSRAKYSGPPAGLTLAAHRALPLAAA